MRKFVALIAAAMLVMGLAGTALGNVTPQWAKPAVTANCAPDTDHYAWTVTLSGTENNYGFQWSFDNDGPWTKADGVKGDNALVTPRGGDTLYVRWDSDHGSIGHATANGDLCVKPPEPPVVQTSDCTVIDGQGAITVTGLVADFEPSVSVHKGSVDGEVALSITKDGTYPLDPGDYNWTYGDKTGGGGPGHDFTIGACPRPTPAPVLPTFQTSCEAITVTGVTDGWQFIVEPGDMLLTDGTTALAPGDYSWNARFNGDDIDSGKFSIEACATPPPPVTIHFLKEVVGGSAEPTDFWMSLTAGDTSFKGVNGDTIQIPAGTYALSEKQLPGYVSEFGGGCYMNSQPESLLKAAQAEPVADPSLTFEAGSEWTCGFRNTWSPEATPSPVPTETPEATATPVVPTAMPTLPPTDTELVSSTSGSVTPILILLALIATAALAIPAKRRVRK